MTTHRSLFRSLLPAVLILAGGAPLAAGATASSPSAPETTLSAVQRGSLARDFVRKWGGYVQRVHRVPVGTWAREMVPLFVDAPAAGFRSALERGKLEDALSDLSGMPVKTQTPVFGPQALSAPAATMPANVNAKLLGDLSRDLVYTPVDPCRIADTRIAGGAIAAQGQRSFLALATSPSDTFAIQGGSNTNCNVVATSASAVVLTITAILPNIAGYAVAYPFGSAQPNASSLNYAAGDVIGNTVVVRVPNPAALSDFTLYTYAQSHYVIDIVGYFAPPQATALDCRDSGYFNEITLAPGTWGTVPATPCFNGYTRVSNSCSTSSAEVTLISSALGGCQARNDDVVNQKVYAQSLCCRVPGR